MRILLVSISAAACLMIAGCGSEEVDEEGTVYCCALNLLCTQEPTIELAPCFADRSFLTAANEGKESNCRRIIEHNDLRVHKYRCDAPGHSEDCWYEEADALAECR